MAWDDDKSTASDPDNPTANEQITATEWDNHVNDQKRRMLTGSESERPAPENVPEDTLYYNTDNDLIEIRVEGPAWTINNIGSPTEDVPVANFRKVNTVNISRSQLAASGYLDQNQSIPNDTFTRVEFNSSSILDFGTFDTTNEIGKYQVEIDGTGVWNLSASVQITGFSSTVAIQIVKEFTDGSTNTLAYRSRNVGSFQTISINQSADLVSGDKVYVEVRQRSGSSQDILGSESATQFSYTHIG